jgi:hypothetical protein
MDPSTSAPQRRRTLRRTIAAGVAAGLLLVACGDDDDTATAGTPAPTESAGADGTTTAAPDAAADTVEVSLVDYKFEGLPESVPVGTKLTVVNKSTLELHELVAFKLPADETRTAGQIAALPEDELNTLFAGPPTMVLLAPPGGEQIAAVGDGTLSETGRYLVFCSIPTGADPAEYLDAANASADGPPQVEGGPPHFMNGMYADVTVE